MNAAIPEAVYPPRGQLVHLYLPDYAPGPKSRSNVVEVAMCNAAANETTPPPVGPLPTGRKRVPLSQAVGSAAFLAPGPNDPRPFWRWCAICLGRAVEHYGLAGVVLDQILKEDKP